MALEALSFKITAYYKRPKGEPGLTQVSTVRITPSAALQFVLDEMLDAQPVDESENAITTKRDDADLVTTITIDWSKLPESVTKPKLPARRF